MTSSCKVTKANLAASVRVAVSLADRYPRTLFEWLRRDDKMLLSGIDAGQSVLEIAEDLQREHVSVLNRLDYLGVYEFEPYSEEWVEVMGLGLAGVPLRQVVDWCTASPERLSAEDLEAQTMGDLRAEFIFARNYAILVSHSDCISDLSWLMTHCSSDAARVTDACERIVDRFDVITPMTLKNEWLGITPVLPRLAWKTASSSPRPASTLAGRKYTSKRSGWRRTSGAKTYRRKSSSSRSRRATA